MHALAAVLFGVVGVLMVWRPIVTAEIVTLLMGAFFLVAGLFQLIEPFWIGLPGWGWHVLNGVITLVLGALVLAQWPISGLWVIGLFVLSQVWNVAIHTQDGVAYWAHIGGMLAGAALLPLLRHPDVTLFECLREADAT